MMVRDQITIALTGALHAMILAKCPNVVLENHCTADNLGPANFVGHDLCAVFHTAKTPTDSVEKRMHNMRDAFLKILSNDPGQPAILRGYRIPFDGSGDPDDWIWVVELFCAVRDGDDDDEN